MSEERKESQKEPQKKSKNKGRKSTKNISKDKFKACVGSHLKGIKLKLSPDPNKKTTSGRVLGYLTEVNPLKIWDLINHIENTKDFWTIGNKGIS